MKRGKIFFGGTIITMNDKQPSAEAVYIEDGIIKSIGKFEDIKDKYGQNAELLDLQGNVLLPGFIEPHAHFDLCSMVSQMHNISGIDFPKSEDVINEIKKAVKNTPKGEWVMCFGLDFLINRDLPEINRYWLDDITTEHPVALIIQSMHTMFVNSMALEKAGIDRNTNDSRDGRIIKDENGEPLGILTEQSFMTPIINLWLKGVKKNPEQFIQEEFSRWIKKGITTTWTAGYVPLYPNHFELMSKVLNDPNCPMRGDYCVSFNSIETGMVDTDTLTNNNTARSRMTGIKTWYDGSPYTGNMLMYDNYLENDIMQNKLFIPVNQNGESLFSKKDFHDIFKKYHDMGWQLSIHTQGDRSCHEVLEVLAEILKESPRKDHRHRLEHCAFIDADDLALCKELGVTISFHTNHLYYYGEALNEIVIGKERTSKLLPSKSALDNGIKISFHSDDPMYSIDPLRVASNAITRTSKMGTVIGKDQAISVLEALRGITIDAAWQLFREDEIGSIEIGKFADFTIIKENPFEVDPNHIGDIEIVTTYIDGIDTRTLHFS